MGTRSARQLAAFRAPAQGSTGSAQSNARLINPVQRCGRGLEAPRRVAGCPPCHELSPRHVTANRMHSSRLPAQLALRGYVQHVPLAGVTPAPQAQTPSLPPNPRPLTLRSTPWGSRSVSRASRACRYATSSAAYCSCRGDSGRRSQNCSTVHRVWVGLVGHACLWCKEMQTLRCYLPGCQEAPPLHRRQGAVLGLRSWCRQARNGALQSALHAQPQREHPTTAPLIHPSVHGACVTCHASLSRRALCGHSSESSSSTANLSTTTLLGPLTFWSAGVLVMLTSTLRPQGHTLGTDPWVVCVLPRHGLLADACGTALHLQIVRQALVQRFGQPTDVPHTQALHVAAHSNLCRATRAAGACMQRRYV